MYSPGDGDCVDVVESCVGSWLEVVGSEEEDDDDDDDEVGVAAPRLDVQPSEAPLTWVQPLI